MSKGLAQRRRLKRALDAARGNLHKIANGKALPSELPEAPKTQPTEKLPASLRKMLALKEAAEKQGKKTRFPGTQDAAQPQAQGRRTAPAAQQADGGDGPSTSGRNKEPGQDQRQGSSAAAKGGAGQLKGGNAFLAEQFVEKKLKDKKKQYLKLKQDKKRKKGSEIVVEKELQLRDHVKFGEVVDAPLDVHLKRKHWVDQERSANQRCKEVFLKQMHQAQQRLAGATQDEGLVLPGAKRKQAGRGGASAAGGASRAGGGAKGTKRKAPMDAETEQLRLLVIESYRATKKTSGIHGAAVGNATMASLAHLVGKASGSKAATAKTHTLD